MKNNLTRCFRFFVLTAFLFSLGRAACAWTIPSSANGLSARAASISAMPVQSAGKTAKDLSAAPSSISDVLVPTYGNAPQQQEALLVMPDSGYTALLDAINGARNSINLTIYELDDPKIVGALSSAAQRGVKVRIIYNYYSFMQYSGHCPNDKPMAALAQAGAEVKKASQLYAITHQKTLTIDNSCSFIMTFNLRTNYFTNTRDFGIITRNPAEIEEISRVFEADWIGSPVSVSNPELVWSPDNSRSKILGIINSAKTSLEVYNEETGDKESMQALINAAKRGVTVRFITADLTHNGMDGNAAERQVLNQNGVQAKAGPQPLYFHAKMVLADYGTPGEDAYTGSENFSSYSLDKNRELGIIVNVTEILTGLDKVFETDWTKSHT